MTVHEAPPEHAPSRPAGKNGETPGPAAAPRPASRRLQNRLMVASALSAALAVVGFAAGARQAGTIGGAEAAAPTASAAPADLGRLASLAGCTLRPGTRNSDYRQGSCTTSGGQIVMITFTTVDGQNAWKEDAESYGLYLVGPRWVVGGQPALLNRLKARLGGTVEGSQHSGH